MHVRRCEPGSVPLLLQLMPPAAVVTASPAMWVPAALFIDWLWRGDGRLRVHVVWTR